MTKTVPLALCAVLGFTSSCLAAEGTAVGVNPDALAQAGTEQRTLVVGADVSVGERIVTGPSGRVQLLFQDETRIVVGPHSELLIESYLLSGDPASRFAVNALAGTFRFISGNSPKSAYSVETPNASIAVRGTEYDLTVGGGQTLVMLYNGALQICQGSVCYDLTNRCDIAVVGSPADGLFEWTAGTRDTAGFFPLPNIQSAFLGDFRVAGAQACLSPKTERRPSSDDNRRRSEEDETGSPQTPPPPPPPSTTPPPPSTQNPGSSNGGS